MSKQIFVNLPVKDLNKSVEFFKKLGFTFNLDFTDENGTCMVVSESIFVMLLTEEFFKTFTTKDVCDATQCTEAIIALSVDNKEDVDKMVETAISAGGKASKDKYDYGWMVGGSFQDLDGHIWEVLFIDETVPRDPSKEVNN